MPTFTVLLPVRNGVDYLSVAIESVVNQVYQDWKLLVLDHGSTDGSAALAAKYADKDKRIQVCELGSVDGLSALLNHGISQSDSLYIIRQDADDVSLPNRMTSLLNAFEDNPSISVVGSQAYTIDSAGRRVGEIRYPTEAKRITAAYFFWNPIAHPSAAFALRDFRALGAEYGKGFLPSGGPLHVPGLAEDHLLFGQFALLGKCINLPERLIEYRYHPGSVSQRRFEEQRLISARVSRFLASAFSAHFGLRSFDPAPFSNFGNVTFAFPDDFDPESAYRNMAETLRTGLGESVHLSRELAFRWVLGTRHPLRLAARYARYAQQGTPLPNERSTVVNFFKKKVKGTPESILHSSTSRGFQ